MNSGEIHILAWTAFTIGFVHTLFGPDHYLPFIVLSKSRNWSIFKTAFITFLCGLGHVLGSVVIGMLGISLSIAVSNIESIESIRGNLAAYLLLIFGLTYFIWGVYRAVKNRPHSHTHLHPRGVIHLHSHIHSEEHMHLHEPQERKNLTPWMLFIIFAFGPCEPLIPILMYPAAKQSFISLLLITAVFAVTTITTMLALVLLGTFGLSKIKFNKLDRYSHAIAGLTIFLSGYAILFLGL